MIRVIKDISNKPSSLSSPACLSSLNSVIQGDKSEIKSKYYRGIETVTSDGSRSREVVEALKALYHNKCAYCETFEFDPEIEHYRPK